MYFLRIMYFLVVGTSEEKSAEESKKKKRKSCKLSYCISSILVISCFSLGLKNRFQGEL